MKKTIRTTWKGDWLLEFSVAFTVLGAVTREPVLASVGVILALTVSVLGVRFRATVTQMRSRLQLQALLSKHQFPLYETVYGGLLVRNKADTVARVMRITASVDKDLRFDIQGPGAGSVQPGKEMEVVFRLTPLATGRLQISQFQLTLTDARGLFTAQLPFHEPVTLETYLGLIQPLTPLSLYAGGSSTSQKIATGVDYAGIREYAPGDEDHRVEWKATARLRKLMVKEFHPETETGLQILVDTGKTMRQQAYVGTRLDEALAVAELLAQAGTNMEQTVNIYLYNETQLVSKITADQQGKIPTLTAPTKTPAKNTSAGGFRTQPLTTLGSILPDAGRLSAYLRLLGRIIGRGHRRTGVYKAVTAATGDAPESTLVILTDLETNVDALIATAQIHSERGLRFILAQIGAAWRLNLQLNTAYPAYQRNLHNLKALQRFGLATLDLRPELLVDAIVNELSPTPTIKTHDLAT